jgi:crossover junction endodeoxyribonuclease RuvC
VVLLCLARAGIPIAEYAPAKIKRTIAGSGQADKRQVALMVRAALALSGFPR